MTSSEIWTVGRLLTWTADFLKTRGSTSPRLDAEVLLAHARGCQRIELYTAFDEEPEDQQRSAFREMVRQRAEGTPVAYLVGHKEFYSERFDVSPAVLIPRPETEHLVVEALDCLKQMLANDQEGKILQVVDVGTGSGAIGLCIAKHFDRCHVTCVDISPDALKLAQRNAQRLEIDPARVEFVASDLFTAVAADKNFDLIVSNPPYVTLEEYEALDKGVRSFEPKLALVGGKDGLDTIRPLIDAAASRLSPQGYFIFELSPMICSTALELFDDRWITPQVVKDLAGKQRLIKTQLR